MRKIILCVFMASFAACASVKESYGPDGRKAYALNCSGAARGWDKCFSKAGEICKGSGYDVLDRTGESSAAIGGYGNGFYGGLSSERSMIISCKK